MHNKQMQMDAEPTPIKRKPQPNEESDNGEVHKAQEDLAIYK